MTALIIADGVLFSDGSRVEGDAVGIRDGLIVATGALAEVRDAVGAGATEVDAAGGLVTPGFVDAHVHLGVGAMDALRCDLAGATTRDEIDARVRDFAASHTGPWVVGGGWDPALFPAAGPTAAHLDALVPDRPALLLDADHHGAWANSLALSAAAIDARTPDPADGRIERAPDGTPRGALREGAMQLVARLLPPPSTAEVARGILRLSSQLHAAGITGWQEAALGEYGGFPDFTDAYLHLLADGALKGRPTGAIWVPRDLGIDGVDAFVAHVVERSRANAAAGLPSATAKLMLDGIVETRTAHVLDPYVGGTEHGLSYFSPALIERLVPALNAAGVTVHVHAIGDAAVRDALDGFAVVPEADRLRVRNHIAHIQLIHPDDVPRFAALGVTANAQPFWASPTALFRQSTLPVIGEQRRHELYAFASLHRAGARLAMGSDWPVSTFDPWQGIHVAVTRRPAGEPDAEPLGADEALDLASAIDAYTRGSSTLLGLPGGTLRPGAAADLAVADRDPFAAAESGIHSTTTRTTVIAGEVVGG